MQRKRYGWLALSAVLLGAAAWLMSAPGDFTPETKAEVKFPRHLRPQEHERMRRRKVVLQTAAQATAAAPNELPAPPQRRDPVLAAFSSRHHKTAVVIEANAIRHSPVGQLLIECINADESDDLERFQTFAGVNPMEDLDRVIVSDKGMMLSGHFENANWGEIFEKLDSAPYGEGTTIYTMPPSMLAGARTRSGVRGPPRAFGTWQNKALVMGQDENEVREMIDRMDGRAQDDAPPLISEDQTYGEIYGVISTEDIARMLPPDQKDLATRLSEATHQVELHADTQSDVALVADVRGPNGEKIADLGKTFGAALSVGRMQAMASGDKELAQLLDFARVDRRNGSFALEVALPLEVLQKQLASCREKKPAAARESTR